jgi:hypothetical protein
MPPRSNAATSPFGGSDQADRTCAKAPNRCAAIERRKKEKVEAATKLETDVAHYREARERRDSGQL